MFYQNQFPTSFFLLPIHFLVKAYITGNKLVLNHSHFQGGFVEFKGPDGKNVQYTFTYIFVRCFTKSRNGTIIKQGLIDNVLYVDSPPGNSIHINSNLKDWCVFFYLKKRFCGHLRVFVFG